MNSIVVETSAREEFVALTGRIEQAVWDSGVRNGLCLVFVPHTTAGVTINENADPDVQSDFLMALGLAVPDTLPYRHGEGNAPAHVKAGLMGSSVTVIIHDGRLVLGTWQGIYLCEFDGPRRRQVHIQILSQD